jgi:protoheme IX farnesyltransferase
MSVSLSVRTVGTASRRLPAYWALAKPRIVGLLLVTTVPAMILAANGLPSGWLVLATVAGGALAAAGANALNCYLDRDIDAVMRRTRRRPLPARDIEPAHALVFGLALSVSGVALLAMAVNVLAAALTAAANLFYVFVYTMWLKRRTPQNIVIGGAAGAVPPVVGWAAVTGRVGLPAVLMFGIVFLWTPLHFWALSLRYADDYRAAAVPMLPVTEGRDETTRRMLRYAVAVAAISVALGPVAGLGLLYDAVAVVMGLLVVADAAALRRTRDPAAELRVFKRSNVYLAALFVAIAADVLLRSAFVRS